LFYFQASGKSGTELVKARQLEDVLPLCKEMLMRMNVENQTPVEY